jgi:hypothetical protein
MGVEERIQVRYEGEVDGGVGIEDDGIEEDIGVSSDHCVPALLICVRLAKI